jgi:hypothetical protein
MSTQKITPGYSATTYTVPIAVTGQCIGRINQFVVLGAISSDRYAIRWNAIGDVTDWPTAGTDDARSKQSGEQSFPPEFGYVTGIAGNDFYGYIFQERGITRASYVGGNVVFAFDQFEEDRGCVRVGRMVQIDDKVFFESDRGYHLLENDQIADIGYGKVDDNF